MILGPGIIEYHVCCVFNDSPLEQLRLFNANRANPWLILQSCWADSLHLRGESALSGVINHLDKALVTIRTAIDGSGTVPSTQFHTGLGSIRGLFFLKCSTLGSPILWTHQLTDKSTPGTEWKGFNYSVALAASINS